MITVEEKLSKFSSKVLTKANEKRMEKIAMMEEKEQEVLEKKEIEFLEEAYQKIQSSSTTIHKKHIEAYSKVQLGYKKELIAKRQEIFDSVFAAVDDRIKAFTKSDGYYEWLVKNIISAFENALDGEKVIYINESNMEFLDKLRAETGFNIEISNEEIVGGCIAINPSRKLNYDSSMKKHLEEQRKEFLRTSGLNINLI